MIDFSNVPGNLSESLAMNALFSGFKLSRANQGHYAFVQGGDVLMVEVLPQLANGMYGVWLKNNMGGIIAIAKMDKDDL